MVTDEERMQVLPKMLDETARKLPMWKLKQQRDRALGELKRASDELFNPLKEIAGAPEVPLRAPLYTWETHGGFMFVCGPPWVHSLYMGPMENRRLNASYEFKRLDAEIDRRERKYGSVILHSERPYRAQVLYELQHEMSNRDFWELLAHVWTDSENCWQHLHLFREMFASDRDERLYLMDDLERDVYDCLPDRIEIWHGVDGSEFAWTLSKKVALWFANRFPIQGHAPRLRHGFVRKEHVIAYFANRSEEEIVVMPEHVEGVSERFVDPDEVPKRSRGGEEDDS